MAIFGSYDPDTVMPGDDYFRFDASGPSVSRDFGTGVDTVKVTGAPSLTQVRLTFTSAQVGNGNANDSNSMANQDGGLAVRAQAEDASGALTGPISRFDDEGISFFNSGNILFDVRDLVSGVERGNAFSIVRLGTSGDDEFIANTTYRATYINAGMGNDVVAGSRGNDFLVGGAGNDRLSGGDGNDSFIGGAGIDTLFGGNGNDVAIFNASTDGADQVDLGVGDDTVNVSAAAGVTQVRLTFTSAEVGNGNASDGNSMAGQDGGLAVRLQTEDGSDGLAGTVARFDDELTTFVASSAGLTFDIRDLVSGVQRGDQFQVAILGTGGADRIDRSVETRATYVNAGMGKDVVFGGSAADFLVGGGGNDKLNGNGGNDSFIGGAGSDIFVFTGAAGNDRILDFVSGTDRIDLSSYGIDFGDLTITGSGAGSLIAVDTTNDGTADFTITLTTATAQQGDFLL